MIESALQHHKQQRSLATVGSGRYPPATLSNLSNVAEQFVQKRKDTQKIHATATAARTERRTCRTFTKVRPYDSDGKRSNTSDSNNTNATTSGTRTTCCCQNDQKCTERKEQSFIEETATICMHFVFSKLKAADISPVHKKGDPMLKKNYRPVSILPTFSKVYENILFNQISKYMENELSKYLCGFRKKYSTQHALFLLLQNWQDAIDKGNIVGTILMDLSKAYDCIQHDLLIAKFRGIWI